ncbi:MAG: hypothetical protein H2212_03805 [Ruminococcus sp.]|jgi:hypothetical protein|nr:hypothetical protein [Ruminococcus sp.]
MEILARFANKDEKLEKKGYDKFASELGEVYLPQNGIGYSDTIKFGISKFLWMPRITIEGVNMV